MRSASGLSAFPSRLNWHCVCAGPLPKVLPISLEVLNVSGFYFDPHKFTGGIPSEWGALTNLKELNMTNCSLDGKLLSTRSERFIFATEIGVAFYAGPLPKVLPISLEVFNLGDGFRNTNKFTGGIPSEWGALTNLKELKMAFCGLDGKPLRTRTERLWLTFFLLFLQERCPISSVNLSI